MKWRLCAAALLPLGVLLPAAALAYTLGATLTWGPGDPNYTAAVTPQAGTVRLDGLVFGDFLGFNETTPSSPGWGDSGVTSGEASHGKPAPWDDGYTAWVGDGNTNGDALDGRWLWIFKEGGWWDLGTPVDEITVFLSQDHGPYLAEGLEYQVFGADSPWAAATSLEASLLGVYLDGWRPHDAREDLNGNGWQSDDIAGVLRLDRPYRYIKIAAWSDFGNPDELYEPEVDAVAGRPVPEPGTLGMVATGVLALAWRRCGRRRG